MIVTEEEAKQKRCQETFGDRIVGDGNIAEISPDADPLSQGGIAAMHYTSPIHCLGSACMAWRWAGGMGDQDKGTGILLGYCGKAGKP